MIETDHTANQNWFHIRYGSSSPAGLPPVIQAERVVRYRDETGTWVIALWEATGADASVASCILRVPAEQVVAVTRHLDMGAAARQMGSG